VLDAVDRLDDGSEHESSLSFWYSFVGEGVVNEGSGQHVEGLLEVES
jgi:hypothetical protein